MTPVQAIAQLDRQLAKHGQTVVLTRSGSDPITMAAFVRGYKPEDLVGDIQQGDLSVILSPTNIGAFPVPVREGDKVSVAGAVKNVQSAEHVRMLDQLVRINLTVRG
jgi:hypothetical protein